MKTAISIPDKVFARADRAAKKLGVSRSELYTRAISKFVEDLQRNGVTEKLNAVYATEPSGIEPAVRRAQARAVGREVW
jgi:metal-responsive CopG/Arc/MetJ family transcriptional regulator